MPGRRVLVVGDVMMDEYVLGKVRRISPEAPVMVVEVDRDSCTPGGAANVVNNIQALGGIASIVGVVGDDENGRLLCSQLAERGVDVSGVVVDSSRPTTRKTRIIAHSQQVVRVDRESKKRLSDKIVKQVVSYLKQKVDESDIILFSDYDKGMAVPGITQTLISLASAQGKRVIVNPKPRNLKQFSNAFLVSVNQSEAEAGSRVTISCDDDLTRAARGMFNPKTGVPEVVLITRGPDGMSLFTPDGGMVTVPAHPVEVYDVAGAGDTVVSVLSLSIAAGATVHESAILANGAGAAVVRKVGVAAVTREEIAGIMRNGGSDT
jgi:D-beta-D-heptose 7-phosphate kinase/D-beta-D-heptose 1-phosphate adenosyltransferase